MPKTMTLAGLGLAAAAAFGSACDSTGPDRVRNQNATATAPLMIDLDATGRTRFQVEGISGNVTVTGVSGTEAFLIRGEREVRSESVADAEANLDRLRVEVTEAATVIFLRTIQPQEDDGRGYVVNYELTIPERLMSTVRNVNGTVAIGPMANELTVDNVNGNVILTAITGDAAIDLVNGNIIGQVTIAPGGTIGLSVVNGNVMLDIPQATSAFFSAGVVNGSITVTNLTLQNVVSTPTSLEGVLGAGQGDIALQTVNGTILARGF